MLISIWDELIPGRLIAAEPVAVDGECVTMRDLLRARTEQEAGRQKNADSQAQFEHTCRSIEGNGVLVLVDGKQCLRLDEPINLRDGSEILFLNLTRLPNRAPAVAQRVAC